MRRDYFELEVHNVGSSGEDTSGKPTVVIDFHGPSDTLRERLTGLDGELLEASDTDAAFRLQGPEDDPETTGVVSLTNRTNGDFLLELNEDAGNVFDFVRSAREYAESVGEDDGKYRIEINVEGDRVASYEKSMFLVYDEDGGLLRARSLIPSGVEL